MQLNEAFIQEFLINLLKTPSPTGNTDAAIAVVEQACHDLGLETYRTVKRCLVAKLPYNGPADRPAITIASHVDTLGGMVKSIKQNGRLELTALGGYFPGSIVGEYCTVETSRGDLISGTVLLNKQSVHIHGKSELTELNSSLENVEVRLDARTGSAEETEALGIVVGDFVAWDSRTEATESGFIKSRHIDNKAGVAASLGAVEMMLRENIQLKQPTYLFFSTYEEVGHGAATGIPAETEELLVIDMAPVGAGQRSDEFRVTICAKDGSGPYDLAMRRQLVAVAQAEHIPYHLDVYVNYSSDGTAALYGGLDVRVGLIGPGVDASHAYERTHMEAVTNSAKLIAAYLRQ